MDRSAVWTGEIPRSYDLLKGWRRAYIGLGFALTEACFFYGLVAGLLAAFIV